MASSSSSSSPPPPFANPPPRKYDVFISFRGADTRDTFTSHLHAALLRKKIETYMDCRLERGNKIGPSLLQAIEKSKLSLIIFSKHYASSTWCLDELEHILGCSKRYGQIVIPIFYGIDPSEVRKQQESYADAFAQLEERFEDSMDKVLMWRNALQEAANMSGFDNSKRTGTEADFIEEVAKDVLTKLNRTFSSSDFEDLDEFKLTQIKAIESSLCIDSPDVCTVGIWGKRCLTTLGDVLFHRLSCQFEATCFLANVKEVSKRHGLNHLRNVLLREILNDKDLSIDTPSVSSFIRERLSRTKVLIVLDDVNDSSQIEYLAGGRHLRFGPGSRIIITTRDGDLLEKTVDHDKIYRFHHDLRLSFRIMKNAAEFIVGVPLLGKKALSSVAILEDAEDEDGVELDKRFGFSKGLTSRLEVGKEVGRGHFGYTCAARFKKGKFKGQQVAVKVIPKSKMTTAIAIEDVRREVKILRALTGHSNLVQFYDAFEDSDNVYIVMELCEGGELLDRIISRGGKLLEDDAKTVMVQILNVVAFCHLQGVVHRDLKPENFLYSAKDENSQLKAIDFGLSDFAKPDERLNDIVGSAYYVAPEVLHRSYSTEADVWSIGVIAYILLCGSRPFWARTESGIFRAVLKADPSFDEAPWPSLSPEAKDFVKRLLNEDLRKRMTAAQALSHPWIRNYNDVKAPLDILIFRLMKVYMQSSSLRKAALRALSKTLTVDELFYLKEQFALLEPNKNGTIGLDNIRMALMKNATDAMKESRIPDLIALLNALEYRRMDFEEFCAAALSVHQLEALDRWEQHARCAYELFEKDGNRAIVIEELVSVSQELGLGPSIPLHVVLHDWIRHTDGKLSFLGFVKLLHGVSSRTSVKA